MEIGSPLFIGEPRQDLFPLLNALWDNFAEGEIIFNRANLLSADNNLTAGFYNHLTGWQKLCQGIYFNASIIAWENSLAAAGPLAVIIFPSIATISS